MKTTEIANPIYDTVFKYLMEDNKVAKLLVSTIIGEKVVELDPRPQEYTTEQIDVEGKITPLTVYRLDFHAKIKLAEGGYKLVVIELQKASLPTDIVRFQGYLGKRYSEKDKGVVGEDGVPEPLQIYAIYFLGDDLKICDTPVLRVFPTVVDVATQQEVKAKSKFIESLNHKCWIIQISCLKGRRRNEIEQLLAVFDQGNCTSDKHVLNVREEDYPKKYHPVIRRLKAAAADSEVKKRMVIEDEHLEYIKNAIRSARFEERQKAREEMKAEMEGIIAQNAQALAQKDQALEQTLKELQELKQKHGLN